MCECESVSDALGPPGWVSGVRNLLVKPSINQVKSNQIKSKNSEPERERKWATWGVADSANDSEGREAAAIAIE